MKRKNRKNYFFIILALTATVILGVMAGVLNSPLPFGHPPSARGALLEDLSVSPSQSASLPALPGGEPASPLRGGVVADDGEVSPQATEGVLPKKTPPLAKGGAGGDSTPPKSLDLSGYIVNPRTTREGELIPENNAPKRGTLTPSAGVGKPSKLPQTGFEPPERFSIPVGSLDIRKVIR